MPKQKVRQSVETATADKAVEPAPALCDDMPDDFVAFVRLALNAVNTKLDNIVTLQSSMEKELSDIDDRVIGQATSERHSRSFNVRLLGVPETDGETAFLQSKIYSIENSNYREVHR